MHLVCPHCFHPVELPVAPAGGITCPSCGSRLRIAAGTTAAVLEREAEAGAGTDLRAANTPTPSEKATVGPVTRVPHR
jgi:ribosomal protein S27E